METADSIMPSASASSDRTSYKRSAGYRFDPASSSKYRHITRLSIKVLSPSRSNAGILPKGLAARASGAVFNAFVVTGCNATRSCRTASRRRTIVLRTKGDVGEQIRVWDIVGFPFLRRLACKLG